MRHVQPISNAQRHSEPQFSVEGGAVAPIGTAETSYNEFYQSRNVTQLGIEDTEAMVVLVSSCKGGNNTWHIDAGDQEPLCNAPGGGWRRVAKNTIPWHNPCKRCAAKKIGTHASRIEFD